MSLSVIDYLIWDFNHRFADLFGEIKGDNVQTEIDYRRFGDKVEFVAFRNVLNLIGISKKLGGHGGEEDLGYMEYVGKGRAFYSLYCDDPNTIRIYSEKEINPKRVNAKYNGESIHYKDYIVGTQYSCRDWDDFICWLKEAGERFKEIKRERQKVQTIII